MHAAALALQKRMLSKWDERRGSVTAARCAGSFLNAGARSSDCSLASRAPYAACTPAAPCVCFVPQLTTVMSLRQLPKCLLSHHEVMLE
jgi:hypothetical protein